MIIYKETKKQFIEDVFNDEIEGKIDHLVLEKMHRHTGRAEFNSWMNSMQYMYKVLNTSDIPDDSDIAIEYRIPNTNRRVDFIVAGEDETGKHSAVVIELKQWSDLEKVDDQNGVVRTVVGGGLRTVSHPSYQVWSYVSMIRDYNEAVRKYQIELEPCAYLHNYDPSKLTYDNLRDKVYDYYVSQAPCFVRGQAGDLRAFIAKYIKSGNAKTLYEIEYGKIKPSKALQDTLYSLLKGNEEFVLIDDQKVIYEQILAIARLKDNKKRTIIVHGGPGTGKSVLAINLLVQILNMSKNVMYVTKNSAPRDVYTKMLTRGTYRKSQVDNLFKGSGSFTEAYENEFDCLIIDEAHRLNEKSGMFQNMGENQIKELIHASQLSVFFIDDHQRVTFRDIGSTGEIKKWAKKEHSDVFEYTLSAQFRCSGSDGYLNWIDDVLEIKETANDIFDIDYLVKIYDDPNDVYQEIVKRNTNNKARMVAGYCWNWIKEGKVKSDVHDVVIPEYNFGMSWNLASSNTWAIDKESVNEIGCIHTCQGLEFDYVGVIIGDDLRYENDHIVTDYSKRAKTDQSLRGIKKFAKKNPEEAQRRADEIIKNTYRTLLTRGQKGCFIYCTDPNLSAYLKKRLCQE